MVIFMNNIKFFDYRTDEAAQIRQKVFIEEQGFKSEFDDVDSKSMHIVLYHKGIAAGTGRMFTEDGGKTYHLGRIAVLEEYRHLHFGSEIVNAMCNKAKELGAMRCVISAQYRVKAFYNSLGFKESGEIYFDEYCPHIHMEKEL